MDDGLSSVFSFLYLLGILFVRYGCCSLGGNWVGERFDAYDAVLFFDKKGGTGDVDGRGDVFYEDSQQK